MARGSFTLALRAAAAVVHWPSADERDNVAEFSPGRPAPEQVTVYVWAVLPRSMTVAEPDVDREPDHAPVAEHEVALLLDHVMVAL